MTPYDSYILLLFKKKTCLSVLWTCLGKRDSMQAVQAIGRSAFQLTHFVDPMRPVHFRLPQRNKERTPGKLGTMMEFRKNCSGWEIVCFVFFLQFGGKNPRKNGPPIARGWSCLRTTVDILHLDPPPLRFFWAFFTMTRFTVAIIDVWYCLINVFETNIN